MNELRAELQEIAEAIDMCTIALDMSMENDGEYDQQLVAQLDRLLKEKAEIIKKINTLN